MIWALFAGALYVTLRFKNFRWRLLAEDYPATAPRPVIASKRFTTLLAIGGGLAFTRYSGVTVDVCDDGLALRIVPPFSIGAPPIFLPFEKMQVRRTAWYLNSGSFTIKMVRNDVELIIDDSLFSWLQANTDKCPVSS